LKISASIYSSGNGKSLEEIVRELDAYRVDYFHIDCNDEPAVFDDIERIRRISSTAIDLHLIAPEPEKYAALIEKTGVELVTYQYEALTGGSPLPRIPGVRAGLSVVSETDISVFRNYASQLSFILFMATTPGMSGGSFNKENFRKIRNFRSAHPDKKIHVDGGINAGLSFIMRNMGVYAAVVGSYLFKGDFIGSAMMKLRSDDISSQYLIRDFMLEADEIPVIRRDELSIMSVLKTIEDFKMGFTHVADHEGRLLGIISNADVRRGLLATGGDFSGINVASIINKNPACVFEDDTVTDLLAYVKNLSFPVLFLPVIDRERRITGTLKFNNLIKGES
jgi:ribulose-phosphate 3-epimerase